MDHRKPGAIGTHFEDGACTIGSTTGRDPQKQGPIGGVVRCQRQDQKISEWSLPIRSSQAAQFTERTRLGRNGKNNTRIISICLGAEGARRLGHRAGSVSRGTEVRATDFTNEGTRRLRCRVHVKRVQGRQSPIGQPSVNHACPISSALLRGKENTPLTLGHRDRFRPYGGRQQKQPRPRCESNRAQETTPGTNRLKKLNDGAHFTVKNLAFFAH